MLCSELFGNTAEGDSPFEQSQRVAKGYARRMGRGGDRAFIDECQAEAAFIVTELIWEGYDGIMEKYPDEGERHKFYRMSVGYRLKEYWAYRSTSTISYLKKKGIIVKHYSLSHEPKVNVDAVGFSNELLQHHELGRMNIEVDLYILLDSVCTNEVERDILDNHAMGHTKEQIAEKFEISVARVYKILRRIKRRIRNS